MKKEETYTEPCGKAILEKIRLHYPPEEADGVFDRVLRRYERYLSEFGRDLGGRKNPHNRPGGTYDCILLVAYYAECRDKTSFAEIQAIGEDLTVGSFRIFRFADIRMPFFKHLMHLVCRRAEGSCRKWGDYEMHVEPYSREKPVSYCFTRCPFADFVRQFGMQEIAGALCNSDYACMEAMGVKLVRRHTCVESDRCDYAFCSPDDPYLREHPEYTDEQGFIRNR